MSSGGNEPVSDSGKNGHSTFAWNLMRTIEKVSTWRPGSAVFEQVRAVADVLSAAAAPLSIDDIAARFTARGPWKKRLPQIIDTLEALGRVRRDASGTRIV